MGSNDFYFLTILFEEARIKVPIAAHKHGDGNCKSVPIASGQRVLHMTI